MGRRRGSGGSLDEMEIYSIWGAGNFDFLEYSEELGFLGIQIDDGVGWWLELTWS